MNAKQWIPLISVIAVAAVLVWAVAGCKQEPEPGAGPTHTSTSGDGTVQTATVQTTCPVMGNPINKDIFVEYKGQKVYFCCPACVDQFNADPEKYLDKLPQFKDAQEAGQGAGEKAATDVAKGAEAAVKGAAEAAGKAVEGAASAAGSLLAGATEQTTCPIMGNPINKDVFVEYKGQKVYFCCEDCKAKFNADPEKYVADLPQFKK